MRTVKTTIAYLLLFVVASTSLALDMTTRDGTTYQNVTVTAVEPDGLRVTHSNGAAKLLFVELPTAIQQLYHYDPSKAAEYQSRIADAKRAIAQKAEERERLRREAALNSAEDSRRQLALEQRAQENSVRPIDPPQPAVASSATHSDATNPIIYVFGGAAVIAALVLFGGITTACPSCHRWLSRQALNRQITGTEQYNKTVTHKDRSYRQGDESDYRSHVITERKQVVSVERVHYVTRYQCKHCNHLWDEASYSDNG